MPYIDLETRTLISPGGEEKLRRDGKLGMERFWFISDPDKLKDEIVRILSVDENYGLAPSISSILEVLRVTHGRGLSDIHRLESILIALGFTVNRWIASGVRAGPDDPDRPHMRRTVTL